MKVAGVYNLSDPKGFATAAAMSLGLETTPTATGGADRPRRRALKFFRRTHGGKSPSPASSPGSRRMRTGALGIIDMSIKPWLGCGVAAAVIVLALPAVAQERNFDIPAQDLSAAISHFGRQSGLQIVAPADVMAGLRSTAVSGRMEARAALSRLIQDAGLEVASDADGVIVLRRAAPGFQGPPAAPAAVEDVVVTAQKRDQRAQEVPIALTAFSGATLERHQLETLRDVSRLTPGLLVSSFNQSRPDHRRARRDQHLQPDRRQQAGRRGRRRPVHPAQQRRDLRALRPQLHPGAEGPAGHPVRSQRHRRRRGAGHRQARLWRSGRLGPSLGRLVRSAPIRRLR